MRIYLDNYHKIGRDATQVRLAYGKDVYAFVHEKNDWVNRGFYNLKAVPAIWVKGMIDLLDDNEVCFMIEKGEE